jgi:hypothetical protein
MKKPQYPKHYLNLNGDGTEAVEKYEKMLLGAARQYVDYHYGEEELEGRALESRLVGVAMMLNQKQRALTEIAEQKLMNRAYSHALFSEFQTMEEWLDHHNIQSHKSEYLAVAQDIIPWCQQYRVLSDDPEATEKWFLRLQNNQTVIRRVFIFVPMMREIIRSDWTISRKKKEMRQLLSYVDNPKITYRELENAAKAGFGGAAVGSATKLGETYFVSLRLTEQQFEYLQAQKLRGLVDWDRQDFFAPDDSWNIWDHVDKIES